MRNTEMGSDTQISLKTNVLTLITSVIKKEIDINLHINTDM